MDFPDEHKMKTKTSGSTKEDRSCGDFFPLCNVMKTYCAKTLEIDWCLLSETVSSDPNPDQDIK